MQLPPGAASSIVAPGLFASTSAASAAGFAIGDAVIVHSLTAQHYNNKLAIVEGAANPYWTYISHPY